MLPKFQLAFLCSAMLLLGGAFARLAGEDIVHYQSRDDGRAARVSGEVLQYTGRQLILRSASGREASIPSDRVRRIESRWLPAHEEADRLYSHHQFEEALRQYGAALRDEKRVWVRDRLFARAAWCYRALGDPERAADAVMFMLRDDHDTPYLDALPLFWQPYQPTLTQERRALERLQARSAPAVVLMGASWLLSGREGVSARHALERLSGDQDPRVAQLARTQLWRSETITVTRSELEDWQSTIAQMPVALRAGPYFVFGKALAHHGRIEAAALAYLRLPLLYPHDRSLAPDALLAAGESLEKLAEPDQARRLYGELIEGYPGTTSAERAGQHLLRLAAISSD